MKFPEIFRHSQPGTVYHSESGDPFGVFRIPPFRLGKTTQSRTLMVIASDGSIDEHRHLGWEHVSVSLPKHPKHTPSWEEMCMVKNLFWDKEETVVQFHPAESQHVNIAEVLHLWKKTGEAFPQPPIAAV